MIRPRHYPLLLCLLLSAHLCGCRAGRPTPDERPNAGIVPVPVGLQADSSTSRLPDTIVPQSTAAPGLFRRLFPAKSTPALSSTPRKCKGCTFNYVQGNQSTVTVGKKSTAATGDGAKVAVAGKNSTQATDSAQAVATGGGAAAVGAGASASGGAAPVEAPGWKAALAGPVGKAGAVLLVLALGGVVWYLLPLLPKRKKSDATA